MHIVGFDTVFPFDYTNLGGIDLPLDNGNFTVSSNVIELSSEGLASATGLITFDPVADAYTIPSFTTQMLDAKGLPVTVAQGTLDHLDDTGTVLSTSSTLEITYAPTTYQRDFCVIRVTFASTPEQTIDIFVRVTSTVAASNFSINTSSIDFGDFYVNSQNASFTLELTSSSLPMNPALITISLSPSGALDTTSSFKLRYLGLSTDSLKASYGIYYLPYDQISSSALVQLFYNQVPVGSAVSLAGTNSGLAVPAPMPMPDQTAFSSLLVYKNTSLATYRVTGVSLFGDTMGEYAIDNMALTVDSVLLSNESLYVPITYVQKQVTQIIPKLVLHGVYY